MSQVKDFLRSKEIKFTYINVNIVEGKKILDTKTAVEGQLIFKKSYDNLIKLNKTRSELNTLAIDTRCYHQLDCDNEELFNKYFSAYELKDKTPYYLSLDKKLPHYFVKIINLPLGFDRKALKFGDSTMCDVLVGQWAWCGKDSELLNHDKELAIIDYDDIKSIDLLLKKDFMESKKQDKILKKQIDTKQKEEENKLKKEIKELKKVKPQRQIQARSQLKLLLNKNNKTMVSKIDSLLLDLLPQEMADDRDIWVKVGYIIHDLYKHDYDSGLRRFKRFSALSKKYEADKIESQYASFKNSKEDLTMATVDYYLSETNEGIHTVYKILCECINFQFRDQDLANMFYNLFKNEYICAYMHPRDCWYHYENGVYNELNSKALIESLMPKLGTTLLDYLASLEYAVEMYSNLENESDMNDPDMKYFVNCGTFYKDLLDTVYKADDYCNSARGQEQIYKCCKTLFYNYQFLNLLNQKIHLLGFGEDLLDTSLINSESKLEDLFRKSTSEDYISIKTGMTKQECINSDDDIVEFLNKMYKKENKKEFYLGQYKSFAEKYLKAALPHEGQYEYMLTLLSDSIYGKNRQRFCVNMGIGKNMKSVLQGLMQKAFGDYFGTMKPSFITSKDDENTSSADSDLYSCMYKRSLWISEPPENKSLNGSKMKTLAGNDKIKVREIYHASEEFMPQFSIYINCNTTFKLDPCSDVSLPRRVKFNKFTQYFTNKVDPNNPYHSLADPLISNEEFTTLLSRSLMKVLIEHYIKIDLIDITHEVEELEPIICKDWKAEFIVAGDSFEDFFVENYEVTKDKKDFVVNSQIYSDYVYYCKNNQYKPLSKVSFFNKLSLKFQDPKGYCTRIKTLGIRYKDIEIENNVFDD